MPGNRKKKGAFDKLKEGFMAGFKSNAERAGATESERRKVDDFNRRGGAGFAGSRMKGRR